MSKLQEKKDQIGFRKAPDMCQNCIHFTSKKEEVKYAWSSQTHMTESKLRCSKHGFKVLKMSVCNEHELKS